MISILQITNYFNYRYIFNHCSHLFFVLTIKDYLSFLNMQFCIMLGEPLFSVNRLFCVTEVTEYYVKAVELLSLIIGIVKLRKYRKY